jgi:eukaryotic-like serine/threonine-protein kinase
MNQESIFAVAIAKCSRAERDAYVNETCAGDAELRARIEALLHAHDNPDSYLEGAAAQRSESDILALSEGTVTFERPSPTESQGTMVGPYQLLDLIGEGGMGSVWMAEQTQPVRRKVALKLIKPGMDSRQILARFEAERQALALMDHPNIAKVLDAGTTGEPRATGDPGASATGVFVSPPIAHPPGSPRPYFVMELVKGIPITRYCDQHRLTPRQRLELFVPICHAIQHAHQKGIIHRDLKPSNILVTLYDDRAVPKVIDFGVAKATGQQLTEETLHTGFGAVVGTFEYMSPEQAMLNQLDVDTRSDIYALGVLLYELLAGSTPLERKRLKEAALLEVLRIVREEEPPRPSVRLSGTEALPSIAANRGLEPKRLSGLVRGELDWIVMKALEKDRSRRYETANGFAMDVQRYLADEPVLACPPSAVYRLRKFGRRNKGPVLGASLVLLALLGGIFGTTWGMLRATDAQAVAVHEATERKTAMIAAQESERDAKDQLFLALWNQARAGRFSRQMGQRHESLAAVAKAAAIRPDERLRDEAIGALALPDVRRVPGWHSSPPDPTRVSYGGQYRLYARLDAQGFISIRSIPEDREIQRVASGGSAPITLQLSPDERFLLSLGEGELLRLWRVADGQPALQGEFRGCWANAFSPDGRRLAVGHHDWVVCFDLATGQEDKRWRVRARPTSLSYHPDNSKLAVGYFGHGVASVYDVGSAALVAELPADSGDPIVAWHPDGERLAVAGYDPRIQIWNVAAKRKVAILEGHVQYVQTLTFHPEGELLASHGWDGMLFLWDPSSGRQLMRLTFVGTPHFSADGRRLGVTWHGDKAELLEVTPSREYRTLASSAAAGERYAGIADISPDGRFLVAGMDGGARLWDLRSGREVAALPAGTSCVAFEAAGDAPRGSDQTKLPTALLTGGRDGLLRWPLTGDDADGKRLRLGSPRRLSPLRRPWFVLSPDRRVLAVVTEEGGAIKLLDPVTGAVRRELGPHPLGEVKALSGDGQWAASTGWHSDRVRLWNVGTGQMVHEWVLGKHTSAFFTPDSRTLIISRGDELSFWDIGTLQLTRRLTRDAAAHPGHVAFSPDGRLMAMEMAPAVIHLKEVATGRTVAKLEDPHGDHRPALAFTPDGTQLVAVLSMLAPAVHVWDLRAIRARLKEMNLDWDWPEFPPAPARPAEPPTIQVIPAIGPRPP